MLLFPSIERVATKPMVSPIAGGFLLYAKAFGMLFVYRLPFKAYGFAAAGGGKISQVFGQQLIIVCTGGLRLRKKAGGCE